MAAAEMEVPGCIREGIGGTVLTKLWVLDLLVRTVQYARGQGTSPKGPGIGGQGVEPGLQQGGQASTGAMQYCEELGMVPSASGGAHGDTQAPTSSAQGAELGSRAHSMKSEAGEEGVKSEPEDSAGAASQTARDEEAESQCEKESSETEEIRQFSGDNEVEPPCVKADSESQSSEKEIESQNSGQACKEPELPSSMAGPQSSGLEKGQPPVLDMQRALQSASPQDSSDVSSGYGPRRRGGGGRGYTSSDGYISGKSDERNGGELSDDSGMDSDLEEELCILWDASMIYVSCNFKIGRV